MNTSITQASITPAGRGPLFVGLLRVEAWRGSMLCGVGYALLLETGEQPPAGGLRGEGELTRQASGPGRGGHVSQGAP
jgi:hypothetical protein